MKIFDKILKINWRKVFILVLFTYLFIWSYLFLGILYAEHRQNFIENITNCAMADFSSEIMDSCTEASERNSIKMPFWNFLFVDIEVEEDN